MCSYCMQRAELHAHETTALGPARLQPRGPSSGYSIARDVVV